jgi:protein-S-isoprenylcysteine O-methyltransferase Ste14
MHDLSNVIIVVWVLFWAYWLISAFTSKRNAKYHLNAFIGFRLALLVFVLVVFRPFSRTDFTYYNVVSKNEVLLVAGFILFLAGILLAIWARVYLGKNWGMPMSVKKDPELVTSGPYRYIRHPIYTGFLLAMIGSAISSSIFWLALFVFSAPYFIYSALKEEQLMSKQFPKVYPDYKSKTKMLIPFIF